MVHKLIKHDNYLLVVDDSEIKDVRPYIGRWHLENMTIMNQFPTYLTDLCVCKLIIAHLPLNGSPELEGVDLLPALEDDVEQLAKVFCVNLSDDEEETAILSFGYKKGYNKARDKYKYTEEDIRKAIDMARDLDNVMPFGYMYNPYDIIQYLHQYPAEFECEEQIDYMDENGFYFKSVKTTTINGRRTWVGKYK